MTSFSRLNRHHGNLTAPVMTLDAIRKVAPSAFAADKHSSRSDRYAYVPTSDVIDGMMREGFVPTRAMQSRCRDASKVEHTKHAIFFRRADAVPALGGLYPEIMLVNSHDGSSAFQLYAGLLRLVCMNGLLCGETAEVARIHHKGNAVQNVIDASFTVIDDSRKGLEQAQAQSDVRLNRDQQMVFARAAHLLRFDGSPLGDSIQPESLLRVRRYEDLQPDVFTTLNVIQENVIRGGVTGWQRNEQGRRVRRVTTREIKGIDQNTTLNRALAMLAEEMTRLAA